MACGQFAEPIYKLIEELGDTEEAREKVLDSLVKFLRGQTIEDFVESFRRDYDMNDDENEGLEERIVQTHFAPEVDAPTEDMEIEPGFFSSKIPEC